MLFDLRGRRRRAVQGTYLLLALLMGGGLVFFGVGSDVSGGLFDVFGDRSGSGGNGNEVIEKRVERLEKRVAANPSNTAALQELVRDYYGLATTQQESSSTTFPDEAKDELRKAGAAWQRYVEVTARFADAILALDTSVPTGTYVDMCANLPVVDPERITVPTRRKVAIAFRCWAGARLRAA